ncbi:Hypothetical protein D9617_44g038920 [Elsinoe fawcettii]|nr:Hypothetical protein D9617_44g038920 [Elsinoe fawcettii]
MAKTASWLPDGSSKDFLELVLPTTRSFLEGSLSSSQSLRNSLEPRETGISMPSHSEHIWQHLPLTRPFIETLLSNYITVLAPRQAGLTDEQGTKTIQNIWLPFLLSSRLTLNATILLSATHYSVAFHCSSQELELKVLRSVHLNGLRSAVSVMPVKSDNVLIAAILLSVQCEELADDFGALAVHKSALDRLLEMPDGLGSTETSGL